MQQTSQNLRRTGQARASQMHKERMRRKRRKMLRRKRMLMTGILVFVSFLMGMSVGGRRYEKKLNAEAAGDNKVDLEENDLAGSFDKNKQDILLVNREYALPQGYDPELVTLEDGHQCAKEAYEALCDMLHAGSKEGLALMVCSAYRSSERQAELFEEDLLIFLEQGYTYEQAWKLTAMETMPAGYSEHATGLAFDIVSKEYQLLDEGQAKTAENKWLREHCAEYGFILRYPKDKEDITKISYESWHFRYVGKEAAEEIMQQGICLEEYLGV